MSNEALPILTASGAEEVRRFQARIDGAEDVVIDYTNHAGKRAERRIRPDFIWFGSNSYHPEDQWFLEAWDCEKKANRWFALRDIHSWRAP